MQDTFNILVPVGGNETQQNVKTESLQSSHQIPSHLSQPHSHYKRFQIESPVPTISPSRIFFGLDTDYEAAARGTTRPASRPDSTNTTAPAFKFLGSTRSSSRRASLDSSEPAVAVGMSEDELMAYLNIDGLGLTTPPPVPFQPVYSPNLAFQVSQADHASGGLCSNLMNFSNVPQTFHAAITAPLHPHNHNYNYHQLVRPPTPTNLFSFQGNVHLHNHHHHHHQQQQYQDYLQQQFQNHNLHQQLHNSHYLQVQPYPSQSSNTPISYFSSSPSPHITTSAPSTPSFRAAPRNSAIFNNTTQVTISSPLAVVSSSTPNGAISTSSPSQSSSTPFSPSSSSKTYSTRRLRRHRRRHIAAKKPQHSTESLQVAILSPSRSTSTVSDDTRTREYECDTCHNRFLRRQDLFRHESTHSSARNFLCGYGCGAAFGRSDGATRHMRKRSCRFATMVRRPAAVVVVRSTAVAVAEGDKIVRLKNEDRDNDENDERC